MIFWYQAFQTVVEKALVDNGTVSLKKQTETIEILKLDAVVTKEDGRNGVTNRGRGGP